MAETTILSIKKALDVIDILVFEDIGGKGKSLAELSKRLGQNNTTMHNILKTMVSCGYVSNLGGGLYSAGAKCRDIGMLNGILPGGERYRQLENILTELARELNESLVFTIFSNGMRIPLLRVEASNIIKIDISAFEHDNIYTNATGRVLAAFAKEPVRDAPGGAWDGVDTPEELERRLNKIREDKFYKTIALKGQVAAMAVPVNITPQSALGCYAPVYRCGDKRAEKIISLLMKTAEMIS